VGRCAGWKTLTVNPPFRNRIARESGFAVEAAAHFAQFDIVQSHDAYRGNHLPRRRWRSRHLA
jgi:UDP-glucose:(heptosyl)LPS alpha-1,3-glucosyltransferase